MTRWGHIFNIIYDIKKSEHLNCLIPSAWILIYNAYYETASTTMTTKYKAKACHAKNFTSIWMTVT